MSTLATLWKWAYVHFISDPQVVADLYVEECDEINNGLQCCACYSIVPAEYAICPNCKAQGMDMVWAPGIEEDGGDIAFELEPEIKLTPEQADAIEAGAQLCYSHSTIYDPGDVCPECHHEELLAENPELAQGEEMIRNAVMRRIA